VKALVGAAIAAAVMMACSASASGRPSKKCKTTTSSGALYAGKHTSCGFARNAERKINASGLPKRMRVTSPVTGRTYTLARLFFDPTGYAYGSSRDAGLWIHEVF
jgi:hypothetical protein